MTEKELCNMCAEYNADVKCENKKQCPLISIIKENKELKAELRKVKKERDDLKIEKSWKTSPDLMGRY